ncbi:sensor histidine kinase [Algicola sagamiensis]|uniref:sensor histidine kinase n=1 Tax=Algicola sagamiensis TaxID=163869 RepID=UPI000378366A|nr:PAS domain-containing sensor histidine kinase [Algicola sagamiensis]
MKKAFDIPELEIIMDTVLDGFIIIDDMGVIQSFNQSAVKAFGYQAEEVIGKNVSMLMPEPYRVEHDQYLANYKDTGLKKIIGIGREIIAQRKDGSCYPMELAVNEMQLDGQRYFVGTIRDISERENLIKELKRSNEDLEQFAYVASHDLKSPLNGIKKLVSWIEKDHAENLPQEAIEHFGMIKNRADRMTKLLNDLLEYARVNTKLSDSETVDLHKLCHHTLSLVKNNDAFELSVPQAHINLSRTGLQIVMLNLISNVIKHHHQSHGIIEVDISPCTGGYNLSVTDDGPGIPEQYKDRIFEMFQTLKSRDQVEGSGMGLAMVKKVIAFYGGKVSLDITYTSGCRVQIFWPSKNNTFSMG